MKLIINGITKSYGSTLALSNFTATLELGIYALLGPNGSGKSTLMNIITEYTKITGIRLSRAAGRYVFMPSSASWMTKQSPHTSRVTPHHRPKREIKQQRE